ncbi:hypothetical protein [Janibacter cremeus]|uniref:Thioesterase family protein n=1 Tax=Janibacter cremeus TaxID=1285192 RepID=A0A852VQ13_9MICO|nr:hypothetical protein [Janibacter cremeus]NYF97828.1 hypothetical protein [Janibacter cremeus]
MHTTSLSTTVSDHRAGPPGCGNGGWVCGLLVERLDDLVPAEGGALSATVRLTAPTPVNHPLRWEVDGDVTDPDELAVHLLHEETLLGTAHRSEGPSGLAVPAPVTLEEARTAAAAFDPTGHPFTGCYVCGPDAPDGLHVYASPVDSRPGLLASPVTLDEGGLPPVLAALDCPGAFACGIDEDPLLLGTFVTTVHEEVPRDRELVVLAWSTGREGRKRWSGTALYDGDRLLASAAATWIAVPRDLIPGTAPAA